MKGIKVNGKVVKLNGSFTDMDKLKKALDNINQLDKLKKVDNDIYYQDKCFYQVLENKINVFNLD